ncbi:MAG: ribonuclease J, partial [Candidatus Colwellbacteria bacterium]|nr:ribonuclease J [Candidatus Colwellbacteria bacterium]
THAHYDHIGAIPYLMHRIGNPPIYTTALTKGLVERRQGEFLNTPKLDIRVVKGGESVKLGNWFEAEFFDVSHNVPDTIGAILKTPIGNMVNFADFKVDYDAEGNPTNLEMVRSVAAKGVHALFLDSTGAETIGKSVSERIVEKNLEELIRKAPGRVIVGAFASVISRIAEIIRIAEEADRRVIFSGRSMKENIEIARNLKYVKIKKGTVVPIENIRAYDDKKILILATGAQGEPNAALMRVANGEHKFIQVKPGDTIILSASVIPGNERSVQTLKDNLARQGARIYHSRIVDIHSSGHAPQEDLKMIMGLVKPRFLIPVHGYYFMRSVNAQNAVDVGIPRENIFLPDNGQVLLIEKDRATITKETVPASYVLVDGLGIGDVGEVVLRDRLLLSQEGMIVIIATIDKQNGRMLRNPDIISRGFIYLKENHQVVEEIRGRIKNIVARIPRAENLDSDYLKSLIRDQIGQFVYTKTNRRPMILPVVIEV